MRVRFGVEPQSSNMPILMGVALWLILPLYLLVELLTVSRVTAPYSLVDNTISDAMTAGCGPVPYPWGDVLVCSPLSWLLNAATVASGIALAVGALLLQRGLPRRLARGWAVGLAVVSGLSLVGTGLTPLDVYATVHYLVALPQFLTFPALLVSLAIAVRGQSRTVSRITLIAAGLCSLGAVAFVIRLGEPHGGGLLERIAFWTPLLAVAPAALVVARSTVNPSRPRWDG